MTWTLDRWRAGDRHPWRHYGGDHSYSRALGNGEDRQVLHSMRVSLTVGKDATGMIVVGGQVKEQTRQIYNCGPQY